MTFYLAARWEDRETAKRIRSVICAALGWKCSSRWLEDEPEAKNDAEKALWARLDLDDIDKSDMLILLNPEKNHRSGTGGRHVEFGYAYANGKELTLIGGRENIFHWLPQVDAYATLNEFLEVNAYRER